MALTFQLKRSDKNPSTIKNVLASGEPLLVLRDMADSLLFFGNGQNTVADLYSHGDYLIVSNTQLPKLDSITADMLQDGCVTEDKLDPKLDLVYGADLEKVSESVDDVSAALSNINFAKMYAATCTTQSQNSYKHAIVDKFTSIEGTITSEAYLDKLLGTMLLINFTNANTASNPCLRVYNYAKDGSAEKQVMPAKFIKFGKSRLANPFNWKAGDSVLLVFNREYNSEGEKEYYWYVVNTTAMSVLANWCYNKSTAYINGSKIYPGSINGNQIAEGTITGVQIDDNSITTNHFVSGSLDLSVLDPDVQSAINTATAVANYAKNDRKIIATCSSGTTVYPHKNVWINADQWSTLDVKNGKPSAGSTLLVKFTYAYGSFTSNLQLNVGIKDDTARQTKCNVCYLDDDGNTQDFAYSNSKEKDSFPNTLAWGAGDMRLFVFNGSKWIMSMPTSMTLSIANWCLNNNRTYISGGSIVTGRLSCAELEAGHIDAGTISLSNDTGGFCYAQGSDGKKDTYGIKMYAYSDDENRLKGAAGAYNYFFASSGGVRMGSGDTTFYISSNQYVMPNLLSRTASNVNVKGGLYVDDNGFVKIKTS